MRKDLNMRKGKMIAQGAHASMKFLSEKILNCKRRENSNEIVIQLDYTALDWMENKFTKIAVSINSEQELINLIQKAKDKGITVHSIIDSGKTEFNGVPTLTCAAFGPNEAELIDTITGHLTLL